MIFIEALEDLKKKPSSYQYVFKYIISYLSAKVDIM